MYSNSKGYLEDYSKDQALWLKFLIKKLILNNGNLELKKLEEASSDVNDYYIVAKSVGSIISLIGIEKQIIKAKGIVILGLPLKYSQKNNININKLINTAIKETKILVIQQKNDPIGNYQEVTKVLPTNIKAIEIPGNHHVYGNIKCIKTLVDNFFDIIA